MLVTSKQLILNAQKGKYAVGAFNTSDLEMTKAIISAAEKLRAPVIIEASEKAIAYAGLEELASSTIAAAKKAKVPVALHLDHGGSLEIVSQCLEVGFTSVMYDGSKLSFSENIILTSQAVEMAHRKNVPCEGELGSIDKAGKAVHLNPIEKGFTDPNQVSEFVRKTQVDFLAVSFGSQHGIGDSEKLEIDLLKKIHRKTNLPLVLHGASGVSSADVKAAVQNGICKINIDTDIRHTFAKSIREVATQELGNQKLEDPRDIMKKVMVDIQKLVEEKIRMFGSENKA